HSTAIPPMEGIMAVTAQAYAIVKNIAQFRMRGIVVEMMAHQASIHCTTGATGEPIAVFDCLCPLPCGQIMSLRPSLIAFPIFVLGIVGTSIGMISPGRMVTPSLAIIVVIGALHSETMTLSLLGNDGVRCFRQSLVPGRFSLRATGMLIAFYAAATTGMHRLVKDVVQPCKPYCSTWSGTGGIVT